MTLIRIGGFMTFFANRHNVKPMLLVVASMVVILLSLPDAAIGAFEGFGGQDSLISDCVRDCGASSVLIRIPEIMELMASVPFRARLFGMGLDVLMFVFLFSGLYISLLAVGGLDRVSAQLALARAAVFPLRCSVELIERFEIFATPAFLFDHLIYLLRQLVHGKNRAAIRAAGTQGIRRIPLLALAGWVMGKPSVHAQGRVLAELSKRRLESAKLGRAHNIGVLLFRVADLYVSRSALDQLLASVNARNHGDHALGVSRVVPGVGSRLCEHSLGVYLTAFSQLVFSLVAQASFLCLLSSIIKSDLPIPAKPSGSACRLSLWSPYRAALRLAFPWKRFHQRADEDQYIDHKADERAMPGRFDTLQFNIKLDVFQVFGMCFEQFGLDFVKVFGWAVVRIKHGRLLLGIIRRAHAIISNSLHFFRRGDVTAVGVWVRPGSACPRAIGPSLMDLRGLGVLLDYLLGWFYFIVRVRRLLQVKINRAQDLAVQRTAIILRALRDGFVKGIFCKAEGEFLHDVIIISWRYYFVKPQFLTVSMETGREFAQEFKR